MHSIPTPAYGLHLVVDGYAADPKLARDVNNLYDLLMELPGKIGMHRIGFPHIIQITEEGIKGLSGFVFIMESHISVHTYEERGFITADVYSCKTFDEEKTLQALVETFNIQTYESEVMIRGKQFHNLPSSFPSPLPQSSRTVT